MSTLTAALYALLLGAAAYTLIRAAQAAWSRRQAANTPPASSDWGDDDELDAAFDRITAALDPLPGTVAWLDQLYHATPANRRNTERGTK